MVVVAGGGWWWRLVVCTPNLVFSFGYNQAEQNLNAGTIYEVYCINKIVKLLKNELQVL